MAELRAFVVLVVVVVAALLVAGCGPSVGVVERPPPAPALGPSDQLLASLGHELAAIEAGLASAPDDEALLERRLLVSVMIAELERRRAAGAPPLERSSLERHARGRLAEARDTRPSRDGGKRKPKLITLDEIAIEGANDDPLSGLEGDDDKDWSPPAPTPQAAVVMDAESAVPPAVQRALDDQMARVAPCLPGDQRPRIVVRARWFGDCMRDVDLSSQPSLIPAVAACLVEALEAMRLPESGGMARVLVFPLGIE